VQGADGSYFDVSCLRQNEAAIAQQGRSAALRCVTDPTSSSSAGASRRLQNSRGYYFYFYYLPYYWSNNTTSNSNVCSYFLGSSWNNNSSCYSSIFGYNNNYYSTVGNCYQCLGYLSYCYNTCWNYNYYGYYY
jgi:hypothetical protein